jgi:hypothetical protein
MSAFKVVIALSLLSSFIHSERDNARPSCGIHLRNADAVSWEKVPLRGASGKAKHHDLARGHAQGARLMALIGYRRGTVGLSTLGAFRTYPKVLNSTEDAAFDAGHGALN